MASEIRVPRLGWSMEEGIFLGWRKGDGERVATGEILFELEGEKASQEIEALDDGILRIAPNGPAAGAVVPVGALLGYLAGAEESVTFEPAAERTASATSEISPQTAQATPLASTPSPASRTPCPPAATPPGSVAAAPAAVTTRPAAPPSVRRLARELGVPLDQLAAASPRRVTSDEVRKAAQQSAASGALVREPRRVRQRATPRARRVARELGLSWQHVQGSGRNGRVREQDIRQAALQSAALQSAAPQSAGLQCAAQPGLVAPPAGTRVAASRHRRGIAERMLASQRETAPVTLTSRADATNLVSLRAQFKAAATGGSVIPTLTDIVAKLVALVLRQHPLLTGQWRTDHIALPAGDDLDLGIAVDTEQGLVVPVLRQVVRASLMELAEQSRAIVNRARAGQLRHHDLEGGDFTITNLGSFGIDAFTPIINYPQCAILGVGAIRREPSVSSDGQISTRDLITLSLTFDHRIVDGAPAARFLQAVCGALENPSAWLLAR